MTGIIGTFRGIPIAYCKCGCFPRIIETYDTLQIVCDSCGLHGTKYFGDYYDEAFMMQDPYGDFREIRVVGNIVDNPELLEVQNEM